MDPVVLTLLWIAVIGVVIGLLVWFGPRPSQWRAHEGSESPPEGEERRRGEP